MHAAFVKNHGLGISLILLTWLIFFWRVLFGSQVYFLDDLKILYYPIEQAYAEAQNAGSLPQWSPYFGFGQPLIAWGQLGFFIPVHALLRLLQVHPVILLNISIVTYFGAGLAGMYAWLRYLRISQLPAALGAIVFAFCGFMVGHLNHVNFYTATMVLPWLLFAVHAFLQKPSLPRTATLALLTAVIPLSGQPQISLYTFAIAALFGVIVLLARGKALKTRYGVRAISLTILAATLAFSLASFSILPLREFLPVSDRSDDLPTAELYEFSYPPSHAITLLFPYYFGSHELYWGAKNFQELAAYVGVLPLLLAFIGLLRWRTHVPLRATATLLIMISLAFAPGIYSPIYRLLVENHLLASLAVPGRFVYFFDVGVALLAALGLESILGLFASRGWRAGGPPPSAQRSEHLVGVQAATGPAVGFIVVAATAANLIWWGWDYNPLTDRTTATTPSPFTETLQAYEETHSTPARLYSSETILLAGNAAVVSEPTEPIGPLFTIHQPIRIRSNITCLTIPFTLTNEALESEFTLSLSDEVGAAPFFTRVVTSADITRIPAQRFCPPELTTLAGKDIILSLESEESTTIQALQRVPVADERKAFYVRVVNPSPEQLERSRKNAHLVIMQGQASRPDLENDLLARHIQATARASGARWAGALGIDNFRNFAHIAFSDDEEPIDGDGIHALTRHRNLVNASGVTHLAQSLPASEAELDPVQASDYSLVKEVPRGEALLRLYENPEAFPKAYVVGTAIWEPGVEQTRYGISHSAYDARRLVYISGPTPPASGTIPNAEVVPFDSFPADAFERSRATITQYEPTRVEIAADASQPAWLVLTDSFTPQWHVSIDGQPAPQFIANGVFRAAQLPAGTHTVVFEYRSPAIATSKWLTGIGLATTLLILIAPRLKKLFTRLPQEAASPLPSPPDFH